MKILGLDLSTHIGYAVLCSEKGLLEHGTLHVPKIVTDSNYPEDYILYKRAELAAAIVHDLYVQNSPDKVIIEETNLGRNRFDQKLLEFIHCLVLAWAEGNSPEKIVDKIRYVDSSAWRKALDLRLSKEQSKHNKSVKEAKKQKKKLSGGLARGKIGKKHLSVWWCNQTFGLKLKLKDNDMADAICLAMYGLKKETQFKVSTKISPEELYEKAFKK